MNENSFIHFEYNKPTLEDIEKRVQGLYENIKNRRSIRFFSEESIMSHTFLTNKNTSLSCPYICTHNACFL